MSETFNARESLELIVSEPYCTAFEFDAASIPSKMSFLSVKESEHAERTNTDKATAPQNNFVKTLFNILPPNVEKN